MALQVSMDSNLGFTASEAHVVIQECRVEKRLIEQVNEETEETTMVKTYLVQYNGLIWFNQDAYSNEVSPFGSVNFIFALDAGDEADQYNLLKQCYVHLKTQDGFTDGIDC